VVVSAPCHNLRPEERPNKVLVILLDQYWWILTRGFDDFNWVPMTNVTKGRNWKHYPYLWPLCPTTTSTLCDLLRRQPELFPLSKEHGVDHDDAANNEHMYEEVGRIPPPL